MRNTGFAVLKINIVSPEPLHNSPLWLHHLSHHLMWLQDFLWQALWLHHLNHPQL
jgi:hypothetical protein